MKVAVVSPYAFDAPGGVQDQVARIVGWLRDAGHEAWAVAPGSGGPDGTRHVGAYRAIRANRSVTRIAIDPRVVRKVAEAVAEADVVHLHEPFMPMVSLGALMANTPPIVGTFHADPGAFARGVYRLAGPILPLATSRISVFTAVSLVAASALDGMSLGIRIIPNGIDLGDYRGEGDRDPRTVVFLGRDEPRKGLAVALEAWPLVRARFPEARLRVMGAERDRGPEGVTFLGRLDEAAKRRELGAAAVLVAPNLGAESFGIVVLEGMASGCAIVASDLPAFRAVGGDAVRFVPTADPPALAAAIAALLDDPAGASALGAAARRRSGTFGRDTVLRAYLAAYRDALAGGGSNSGQR